MGQSKLFVFVLFWFSLSLICSQESPVADLSTLLSQSANVGGVETRPEERTTGQLSDENRCLHRMHHRMDNFVTTTLSGLIGLGWDDLTNKVTLPIFATEYHECRTTPDGHFLLPDNVLAIPVQEVIIERIAHAYQKYKDVETESIKASRAAAFIKFVGSGSFSKGNQEIKKHFSNGDTQMLESKVGYKAFTFIAEPNEKLDPGFYRKIKDIVDALEKHNPQLAIYYSESLIRDYGTHVVNKVLTGALTRYRLFTKKDEQHNHQSNVKQSSSKMDLFSIFGVGVEGEDTESKQQREAELSKYEGYSIENKGGPDVRSILDSQNGKQVKGMDNLVALEQEGEPIYSIIHGSYFPEYNSSLLVTIYGLVENATKMYYEENTIIGCMDPSFPNFDYTANVEEPNSCNSTETPLLFNGFFQTCEYIQTIKVNDDGSDDGSEKHLDRWTTDNTLCEKYTITNPIEGGTKCPPNFEAVQFVTAEQKGDQQSYLNINYEEDCPWYDLCNVFNSCTNKETSRESYKFWDRVRTTAYWCRRTEAADASYKGLPFGGIFVDDEINFFTQQSGCPPHYQSYKLFQDVTICISLNNNLGAKHAVHFGGFYSCNSEVKKCADGFVSHFLVDYNGCAVHYCVPPAALKEPVPIPLKRPPYQAFHAAMKHEEHQPTAVEKVVAEVVEEVAEEVAEQGVEQAVENVVETVAQAAVDAAPVDENATA